MEKKLFKVLALKIEPPTKKNVGEITLLFMETPLQNSKSTKIICSKKNNSKYNSDQLKF